LKPGIPGGGFFPGRTGPADGGNGALPPLETARAFGPGPRDKHKGTTPFSPTSLCNNGGGGGGAGGAHTKKIRGKIGQTPGGGNPAAGRRGGPKGAKVFSGGTFDCCWEPGGRGRIRGGGWPLWRGKHCSHAGGPGSGGAGTGKTARARGF